MRTELTEVLENPKEATERRFCWDYWHVPDQYTFLRTPAWEFFTEALYKKFEDELTAYGRKKFGCQNITPPWLSCYVEGCTQALHADVPHGPWAYVFSLTEWQTRIFTGGETKLLKDTTLDYWRNFESMDGVNLPDLVDTIEPEMNQLLVFDPRVPHGVNEVRGVKDPLKGRLVIHGWFTDPSPVVEGGLEGSEEQVLEPINDMLTKLDSVFDEFESVHGTLVLELSCTPVGSVDVVEVLTNTLRDLSWTGSEEKVVTKFVEAAQRVKLPASPSPSCVILPILFRF